MLQQKMRKLTETKITVRKSSRSKENGDSRMAHTKCNKMRIAYSMCTKYKAMDFSDSQIQTHTVRREAFARCRRRRRVCVCVNPKRE